MSGVYRTADDLRAIDLLATPIWIFDVDRNRIWWANRAALTFWRADSIEALHNRDFSTDSPTVRTRLWQALDSARQGEAVEQTWTLYPSGDPVSLSLSMSLIQIDPDARDALLIEAVRLDRSGTRTADRRLLEAARYTATMITYFTLNGEVVAMNPAAANTYGPTSRDEVSFFDRFVDRDAAISIFQEGVRGSEPSGELEVVTIEGHRWHQIALRLSRDPETGDYTVLAVEEDISSLKQALFDLEALNRSLETKVSERTAALMDALEHADQANTAKSTFLAQMSHELRTPMNAILGFAEVLRDAHFGDGIDARYRTYAAGIFKSGSHLLSLINDILDLSKIEAGMYSITKRPIDAAELVMPVIALFAEEARREQIDLQTDIGAPPITATIDDRVARQVLINLISNALKFSPPGGTVTVRVSPAEHDGIRLLVTDTGVGMTDEQIDVALSPFGQVGMSRRLDRPGTGLGLPVSRELAELHGGGLKIDSRPGDGTTVEVWLSAN